MAINVSNSFRELLKANERDYIYGIRITFLNGEILNLSEDDLWDGFKIEDAVSGDDDFQIGSAIINKLTLTLINMYGDFSEYDFFGAEVKVTIGLKLPDGTIETIDKGLFNVDNPHNDTDLITLECLDNMAKFDRPYAESTLTYPATRGEILRDACTHCGVILDTTTFDGSTKVVQQRPDDKALTYRQVVAWIAQLCCKWARCNNQGHLELKWYDMGTLVVETPQVGTYHDIKELTGSPLFAQDDVVITGLQVVTTNIDGSTQSHLSGSQGYILSVEGNDLIGSDEGGTVADELGEKLIGMRFRPMEITCPDDPTREAGDVMIVTDDRGNEYRSVITRVVFTADDDQTITCGAEAPGRNSSTQYSETTKSYVALRRLIRAEQSARETAIQQLQQSLANSSGMYPSEELQEDGSTIYYLHDKPTLAESKAVIKLTAEAIGVSTDGGKTYPYGFALTGEMITRVLQTEGINADWINAGEFTVKDAAGKIIFSANIDTGAVIVSGDHVMIGEKTATQAIQEVAELASNITIQLSNDYQAIPVDGEGNYTNFPECLTEVTVMYGSEDVSAACTYMVAKSDAVTGTWDKSTLTYTVTGLISDTGWVDIKATYAGTLSVTKRFTVAKLYAGATGQPGEAGAAGRVFALEPSATLIKQETGNLLNPGYLEFYAYYRDGINVTREPYNGRFVIEESYDGNTWETVYQSSADETSVRHSLYSFIVDAAGNPVMTAEGYGIAVERDIQEVRVSVYAAGGFTDLLDRQSIPVVLDITALTQDEIFDILTNNGEAKGIYKEGNQLYISFTYAKGGALTLGGPSNGNGKLLILDSTGKQVGYIDNTGVNFEKGTFSGEIYGAEIEGSTIRTDAVNASHYLEMSEGKLDFYSLEAETGYTYAGAVYPSTEEWYDTGNDLWVSHDVASLNLDAKRFLTIKVGGLPALFCYIAENKARTDVYGDLYTMGSATFKEVASSGTKSRIVEGTYHGDRLLYCYETPTPCFGDIGFGQLDEAGECFISIDDIFSETINIDMEYAVFLQKEGEGDIWVDSKEATYFIVKGTPGLAFSWELKATQRGFEQLRLDDQALKDIEIADTSDLEEILEAELLEYDKEMEGLMNESIESIPGN